MKYAVVRVGGKQYKISEGDKINVEKLDVQRNKPVEFKEVLLFVDEGKVKIGQPTLDIPVKAKILDQFKEKKIDVFKYKAKTGYHKKIGHRQTKSKVLIEKIG